jgi:hypothetical protein
MRNLLLSGFLMLALSGNVWSQDMDLNKNWQTWCSGRFMFSLPPQAKLSGESNKYSWYDDDIKSEQSSLEAYKAALQKLEGELRTTRHKVDSSLLRKVVDAGENARILTYWKTPSGKYLATIQGHRYLAGRKFVISTEFEPPVEDAAIQRLRGKLMSLQPRGAKEIPTGPGFCIDRGFFPDEGKTKAKEKVRIYFSFQGHPDMSLSIMTLIEGGGEKLLDRTGGVLGKLGAMASQVHTLRSGERLLGPLEGQEWLVKVPREGGAGHSFVWESQGKGHSDNPFITIELDTALKGDSVDGRPSSLNDEQALALWEAILNSFKLRPN